MKIDQKKRAESVTIVMSGTISVQTGDAVSEGKRGVGYVG